MLAELLTTLFPHPLVAVAAGAAGASAGATALVTAAARRTLAQPIAFALAAEETVLAGVLGDLRRYPYLTTVSPHDFAATSHHNIWAALRDVVGRVADLPEDAADVDVARIGVDLAARHEELLAALLGHLERTSSPETDRARVQELLAVGRARGFAHRVPAGSDPDEQVARADAEVVSAAEAVLAAGNDRNRMSGAGLVIPGTNPNSLLEDQPPLVRAYTPPSVRRRAGAGAATGAAFALLPGFVTLTGLVGVVPLLFATLALVVLTVTSVVLALVDIDTLYIDMRTWKYGTLTAWAATVGAAVTGGDPGRLVGGVVLVTAVALLVEASNLLFRLLRGFDGQGFGDTLVILATVGVPPALTGDWRVGIWSLFAGLAVGIVGWTLGRLTGRLTRQSPFAFGPWLAAGWVLALCWFAFDSLLMNALT